MVTPQSAPPGEKSPRTFGTQVILTVMLLVVGASVLLFLAGRESSTGSETNGQTDGWALPADPRPLVEEAGLDLGPMGMAEHYHPQLRLLVDGAPVQVPAGIGIDPMSGAMSALHTHTPDGELHVEADRKGQRFTLGQLFTQWGVPISLSRVGDAEGQVTVTVDAQTYKGELADLVLQPDQIIELSVRS